MPERPPIGFLPRLSVIALVLVLAGCGSTASSVLPEAASPAPPTPSPTPSQAGRAPTPITLPANWTQVPMTEAGLRDQIAALKSSNPESASTLEGMLASGSFNQFTFFAYDYENGVQTGNMNVTRQSAGGLHLDGVEPQLLGYMAQIPGVSDVTSHRVVLPIGDALLISDNLTMQVSGSDFVQAQHAYFVVQNDVLFAVSSPARRATRAASTTPRR